MEWIDPDGTALEFVCLGVALYGCLQSDGTIYTYNICASHVQINFIPINGCSFSVVEPLGNSATTQVVVVSDNKALSIALYITSVTTAALIVLVSVLVCLLVRKQKAKKDVHPDSGYSFLERSQQSLSEEHGFTATGVQENRYTLYKY